jgi:opacity protein-like surface antigen
MVFPSLENKIQIRYKFNNYQYIYLKGMTMLKKGIMVGLSAFFSLNGFAADSIEVKEFPLVWSSIITLTGGVAWSSPGQNQYLYPNPLPEYEYVTYNSPTTASGTAELFFGLQRTVFPNTIGELGLGVAGVSDSKVTGMVEVSGVPDTYSYSYKVNHARVELKGRLIANSFKIAQPYLSGSFGAAFNDAHEYEPVLAAPFTYPAVWYASNTTVAFAYTLGAGLQTMLTPNWQVAAGYQFADLGKSYLNVLEEGVIVNKGPRLTHFYTNDLLLSVSYLFA